MENSNYHSLAFKARLWPVLQLKIGLQAIRKLSRSAVLLVRIGEVEIRACDDACTTIVSFVMNASTVIPVSPPFTGSYAFRFDVLEVLNHLEFCRSESEAKHKSLWISKITKSSDLRLLLGCQKKSIHLQGAYEACPYTSDLRTLAMLPYRVHLRSDCLREVISAGAFEDSVRISMFWDGITWGLSQPVSHSQLMDQCLVEGVEVERERIITLEPLAHARVLSGLSQLADEIVLGFFSDPTLSRWVAFIFLTDGKSHVAFLARRLRFHLVQLNCPNQVKQ